MCRRTVESLDSWEAWSRRSTDFDAAVVQTPAIATFCSGSDWLLAANASFAQVRAPIIRHRSGHWVALARAEGRRTILQPIETSWSFGCSLVGPDPGEAVSLLVETLAEEPVEWSLAMLAGVPVGSELLRELVRRLSPAYVLKAGQGAHSTLADLHEGAPEYWARRGSRFRGNLRRAEKKALAAGIRFEHAPTSGADPEAIFERILNVERRSWKHQCNVSIYQSLNFRGFYLELTRRLASHGRLRLAFAQREGDDVAYVLGGVLGNSYRGLQMSYDAEYAPLGLGNLLQREMIDRLANERISIYDLGMEIEYKERWADRSLQVLNVFVFHRDDARVANFMA